MREDRVAGRRGGEGEGKGKRWREEEFWKGEE